MKYAIVIAAVILMASCKKETADPAVTCREIYNQKVKSLGDRYSAHQITEDVYAKGITDAIDNYNACLKLAGLK